MARRRAPPRKTVEAVEVEMEDEPEQPPSESEPELEPAEENADHANDIDQQVTLQFDQELSWRPTKPIATGTLLSRLETLHEELSKIDQGEVEIDSLKRVTSQLAHRNLLQHKDRGVKAYTACCLVDLLRLYVPEAPFTDDQLTMMFSLFVREILPGLHDPKNPYSSQHKYVLESLTTVKSILLITDTQGGDELLLRLFNSVFDNVSKSSKSSVEEEVAKDVEIHLTDMLVQLIDESQGSVPASVIDAIISQFLRAAPPGGQRGKEQVATQSTLLIKEEPAAYVMAKTICNSCADKMSRYVSQYFSDVILNASSFASKANGAKHAGDSDDEDAHSGPSDSDLKSLRQAHLLIRELWRAAPDVLQNVVPQLDAELSADNVHLRLLATETFGDMISGIGAAGPPPLPILDPSAYPPLSLLDERTATAGDKNILTRPFCQQSFSQAHHATYRNFVGRRNDKAAVIRAAWATAAGYILSTSGGGIGLSREDEKELIDGLNEKMNDSDEKVRLAAVKTIELFEFRDVLQKLGINGGVQKEGSIFASLADRCRDKRPAVRVDAMVILGKLWAVGAGEIAAGQEAATACLAEVPSRIIKTFYANDPDVNVLLDRVLFECLVPLRYPAVKGKGAKKGGDSQARGTLSQSEQDQLRAERILLMVKSLDEPARRAFFAMQARQPSFAKGVSIFIGQCEAYNGGIVDGDEEKVKSGLNKTLHWFGTSFPDPLKVRSDLQKFAKVNDRRTYQLIKYAIESESDFITVRRAMNELIAKVQGGPAAVSLDTLIPLMYRSSSLVFNRSHLSTIMDYSKNDKEGFATVAHQVLNDISTRNPDLFKAHSEELRKEIIAKTPKEKQANDPSVVDILKAYSSYSKRYPEDLNLDRSFTQTLTNYALYGSPPKAAKYAINILLAKNDDKGKVAANALLRSVMKDWNYGVPNFLNKLATVSQLSRVAPTVTQDHDKEIHDLTVKGILRQVRTDADPSATSAWVEENEIDEELEAKRLSLTILANQTIANAEEPNSEDSAKAVLKLLKTFVANEGEFCKVKDTPLHHKKRLRLLAGQLILKICAIKKYDDIFDAASFNKLAELVQDSELQVRRRFTEKLQNYLTRGKLRPRFYTILFIVAFEPNPDLKSRVETWIRSRARHYEETKKQMMEAIMGRLIPLLAHHPDFTPSVDDLADFANYFLFYLNCVATPENVSLIYKYAERVKQTRDAISPDASDNLYVLSDLAQSVTRKFQERRNWSFQAYPGKVGLPAGLYLGLPSSEVAQEIAKKIYIPEELDSKLDEALRAIDRKKKRKSMGDWGEPTAKKPRTQMKTVIREKPASRAKSSASKKTARRSARAEDEYEESSTMLLAERRRSGRSHRASNYVERDDEADEAEMLEGVAKWAGGDGQVLESESSDQEDEEEAEEAQFETGETSAEEDQPAPTRPGRGARASAPKSAPRPAPKPAPRRGVKASVLSGNRSGTRTSRRGRPAEDADMDVDES